MPATLTDAEVDTIAQHLGRLQAPPFQPMLRACPTTPRQMHEMHAKARRDLRAVIHEMAQNEKDDTSLAI